MVNLERTGGIVGLMKTDDKKPGEAAQHELRRRVIALKREGKTGKETAELTGLSSARVSTIWRRHLSGGTEAPGPRARGRRQGEGRTLSSGQEEKLREMIRDKTPRAFGLNDHLWTREGMKDAAKITFDVTLPLRTVSNYLKRWGMVLPEAATFRKWVSADHPEFLGRIQQEGAGVYWFTETSVEGGSTGDLPGLRMLTAVNSRGRCRFMLCNGALTGRVFVRFLSRLCRDTEKKICLVATTPLPRRGKAISSWLGQHKNRITVYFDPNLASPGKINGR